MTDISLELRMAMVWAGSPSCQRKLLGAAKIKSPWERSGCFKVLSVRVCVKSAVHVLRFDWAASHWLMKALVSAADAERVNRRKQRERRIIVWAKLGQSCTIGRRSGELKPRRRR